MQRPGMLDLAFDAMTFDEIEHKLRRVAQESEKTLAVIAAEHVGKHIRHHPHAGIDQTDVPAGPAKADLNRFKQCDVGARLREMERRRETGIATADNDRVDLDRSEQPEGFRRRWRGQIPWSLGIDRATGA